MYPETSKIGIEVRRKSGSIPDFNTRMPCEKGRETNQAKVLWNQ